MNVRKKMLPIGIEDFTEIRKGEFYYIDKTGMIGELLDNQGKVNLFTRPRRFGKSLNMSMLKSFFDLSGDQKIFQDLKISEEKSLCDKYMGKFPVISISLKGVNGIHYENARAMMCAAIGKEAMRFPFLLESEKLTEREKETYAQLTNVDKEGHELFHMSDAVLEESLHTLSELLERHYGSKTVILIDEYDVPLAKASEQGYYDQMVMLLRNMFTQALKTNESLQFAVLTGCMRIAKESIFTGLNNLRVLSITDVRFDEYFGFTDREVRDLLEYYELSDHYETIREWYDGYQFGDVEVYCPWDVINYCDALRADSGAQPKDYWSNTSGNDVVRRFIQEADNGATKREIEALVAGEIIRKEIHQDLTYRDMYQNIGNIWSVLFTTGYLTQRGKPDGDYLFLAIPNMEIRRIFTRQIMEYFRDHIKKDGESVNMFCEALKNGNTKDAEKQLQAYLRKTISIRDTFVKKKMKENFYHGILVGLLGFKESWSVFSNKESGEGYSDILVEIDEEQTGIVIEMKYAEDGDLESSCRDALEQIAKNRYEEQLLDDGMEHVLKYGISCYKKRCKIVRMQETKE